jgi:hypothetical protein
MESHLSLGFFLVFNTHSTQGSENIRGKTIACERETSGSNRRDQLGGDGSHHR